MSPRRRLFRRTPDPVDTGAGEAFRASFQRHLTECRWEPHPHLSVFTQYGAEFYLSQRDAFVHKYRCFFSVARTISPAVMIELGVCAGSGADAYLSGSPTSRYIGIDTFGEPFFEGDGSPWRSLAPGPWKPYDIARALLDGRVEYTVPIDYTGGGLVIKLRPA